MFWETERVYFKDWLSDQVERWVKPIFCATIWSKSPEIAQNPYLAAACCRDVFDPSKLLEDLIYYRCFQIYTPIKQVKVS